jgi:hypothetical protein
MVTPEVTQALQPGDKNPLPVMPREFLPPVVPEKERSALPGEIRASDESAVERVELFKKENKEDIKEKTAKKDKAASKDSKKG